MPTDVVSRRSQQGRIPVVPRESAKKCLPACSTWKVARGARVAAAVGGSMAASRLHRVGMRAASALLRPNLIARDGSVGAEHGRKPLRIGVAIAVRDNAIFFDPAVERLVDGREPQAVI